MFEQTCIVELMGHNMIAGKVTEQTIGGQGFVRVDVPVAVGRGPALPVSIDDRNDLDLVGHLQFLEQPDDTRRARTRCMIERDHVCLPDDALSLHGLS